MASEVAMSWLAGDIARIMQLGCKRYAQYKFTFSTNIFATKAATEHKQNIYLRNQHCKWGAG